MSQTINFDIIVGISQTGLTLQAQIITSSGSNYGSPITSGFVEIGNGNYLWSATIPDSFIGGVKFLKMDNTLMAFTSINPNQLSPSGLDNVTIENGVNARQAIAVVSSILAGLISGSGTSQIQIQAMNNPGTTRVNAIVANNGDRTAVILSLP